MGNNLVTYVSQWMTVQPSLFGFLDDEQKTFVRVCSWTLAEQDFFLPPAALLYRPESQG